MAGCGGWRSLANPRCIGTILVLFVAVNVIFYRYRLGSDKQVVVATKKDLVDAVQTSADIRKIGVPLSLLLDLNKNGTKNSPNKSEVHGQSDKVGTSYKAGDIPKLLDSLKSLRERVEKGRADEKLPDCKPSSLGLMKPVETDLSKIQQILNQKYPDVTGGLWRPSECHPVHRTAILVPYRNRTNNLMIFLNHMHRFLQTQLVDYGIFVIEQADSKKFNRAKLLNVGFVETQKFHPYDCFVLHDIDKIPENTKNLYACESKPKHLISQRHTQGEDKYKPGLLYNWYFGGATSISANQFRYINGLSNLYWGWGREDDDFAARMTYNWYFGGVSALKREHFLKINGMSNLYWGWGREDDDLAARVRVRGLGGIFPRGTDGQYLILDHHDDREENKMKWPYMNVIKQKMVTDGLNSLNYTIKDVAIEPLYTKISVLL